MVCLAVAGAADSVSGVFRGTIWNETIPGDLRGRLAGVEMISYISGPLMGNARAGLVASISSNTISVVSGGVTYLDYAVTVAAGVSSAAITIDGYATNGTDRVNFDLGTTLSGSDSFVVTEREYLLAHDLAGFMALAGDQ